MRYLVVGMSAALLQGARGATEDIDLWFEQISDARIGDAARKAGGVWVTRTQPPLLGGAAGDRWDVVTTMSGLPDFDREYANAKELALDGIPVLLLQQLLISFGNSALHSAKRPPSGGPPRRS